MDYYDIYLRYHNDENGTVKDEDISEALLHISDKRYPYTALAV